jgi:hypothetical protein
LYSLKHTPLMYLLQQIMYKYTCSEQMQHTFM